MSDLISRQAVNTLVDELARAISDERCFMSRGRSTGEIMSDILNLPPAENKGEWIIQPSNKEQGERDFIWWKCSVCGQVIYFETEKDRKEFHAFCGRCGAKMVEKQKIHRNCTDEEIAKSFIDDVEIVKDLLPRAEKGGE